MTAAMLLTFAIRLGAFVAVAAIVNAVRPRAAASEKHWIWMAALGGSLVLPFAQLVIPPWPVGPAIGALSVVAQSPVNAPIVEARHREGATSTDQPASVRGTRATTVHGHTTAAPMWSPNAVPVALVLWMVGSLLCLVRLVRAHARARRIVKRARLLGMSTEQGVRLPVLESDETAGPFTYGVFRPSIVIPHSAAEWSGDRRAAVVTHETAHALRRDGLSLLVAEIACVTYWWHPAILFAARRAAITCERACDDAVVRGGMRASDYGTQLLAQAQASCAWGIRPLATTLFGPSYGIAARIAALLDPRLDRRSLMGRRALVVNVVGLGALALVAAATPRNQNVPTARPTLAAMPTATLPTVPVSVSRVETATKASGTIVTKGRSRTTFSPACAQADARFARTFKVDSSLSFRGAGSTRYADGSVLLVWTGTDCVASLRVRGPVNVDPSWSAISVGPGGEFAAHDDGPAGRRDYVVRPDGSATLTVNGAPIPIAAEQREWTAMMILEYVRRAGLDVNARARSILANGRVAGLLDEARKIAGKEVRKRYLEVAIAEIEPANRSRFVHDAASLLDSAFVRGEFLLAIPREWRENQDVLATMYAEAGVIEPDDYIEQLLRVAPPPRPLPASLKPLVEKLIASLQSVDRRTALRGYYLDVRP